MKFEKHEFDTAVKIIELLESNADICDELGETDDYARFGTTKHGQALRWFAGCLANTIGLRTPDYSKLEDAMRRDGLL